MSSLLHTRASPLPPYTLFGTLLSFSMRTFFSRPLFYFSPCATFTVSSLGYPSTLSPNTYCTTHLAPFPKIIYCIDSGSSVDMFVSSLEARRVSRWSPVPLSGLSQYQRAHILPLREENTHLRSSRSFSPCRQALRTRDHASCSPSPSLPFNFDPAGGRIPTRPSTLPPTELPAMTVHLSIPSSSRLTTSLSAEEKANNEAGLRAVSVAIRSASRIVVLSGTFEPLTVDYSEAVLISFRCSLSQSWC